LPSLAARGNLTLTGAVKYPSQRTAAESAIGGLTGVGKTEDEIGFVFAADPANVNLLVEEALAEPKVPVDDSRVVTNISGNTVTLIGHVRTEAPRDAVVRAAWRGHHVMAVIDQIEITG
jgi:osmotically-inducible protein OsmY